MSMYDYQASREIAQADWSFDALIMAAMRRADCTNRELLVQAFPKLWDELQARHNAPGGALLRDTAPAPEAPEPTVRDWGREM